MDNGKTNFFCSVCMLSDGKNQSLIFHDEENHGRY